MKEQITVAGLQIFCDRSPEEMLVKAEIYMDRACKIRSDIDLMVLPEHFYQRTGQPGHRNYETQHGRLEKWLQGCALKYHTNIIAGSYPVRITQNRAQKNPDKDQIINRCLVAGRTGQIIGHYDKIHLFDAFGIKESDTFEAGNTLGLFELDFGTVGLWICYDTRFPEISRALTQKGADLLCVPAAFYRPNADQWEIMLKSAAIYNLLPVVAVNQYGTLENGRGFCGRSMFLDQKGIITAGISDQEGVFVGEIDLAYTEKCRAENPALQNRRPDLYREWL